MEYEELGLIAEHWDYMTMRALNLQEISLVEMHALLRDTYMALTQFHKELLVPKEITKILLNIEEYLYFASLMEEKEVSEGHYCYRQLNLIVNAFKKGFFAEEYPCVFPQLQIIDEFDKHHVLDLEGDFLPLWD